MLRLDHAQSIVGTRAAAAPAGGGSAAVTEQAIRQLIARMAVDTEFAERVRSDRTALSGYELTDAEVRRLSELTGENHDQPVLLGERLSRSGLFFPSAGHLAASAADAAAQLHAHDASTAHLALDVRDHDGGQGHDAVAAGHWTPQDGASEREGADAGVVSQLGPVGETAPQAPVDIPLPADLAAIFGHHDAAAVPTGFEGSIAGDHGASAWAHDGGAVTSIYDGSVQASSHAAGAETAAGLATHHSLHGGALLAAEHRSLGPMELLPHSVTVQPSDIPVIGDVHGELESIPLIGGLVQLGDTLTHVVEGAAGEVAHFADPRNW